MPVSVARGDDFDVLSVALAGALSSFSRSVDDPDLLVVREPPSELASIDYTWRRTYDGRGYR